MNKHCKIIVFLSLIMVGATPVFAQTYNLQYYLQQGQENSPLLKDYQNQISSRTVDSSLIRAQQLPQVLANGQVLIAPTVNGYGYDQAVTNGGNYRAVIGVSQPLFNQNKIVPQYQKIRLQNKTLQNKTKITRLGLQQNITAQYITAYAYYQQLQSNKAGFQLLQRQQAILKKLVKAGIYNPSDYLNLKVSLQTQEIAVSQLKIQYQTAVSGLNYLCGIRDTSTVQLAAPILGIKNLSSNDSSLFYRKYVIDSLKIINQKAIIDTKYKPSLSWFANAGLQSSMPSTMYQNFGVSFGLNLSIPIYDGKQRKLKEQKLKIVENTRENYALFFYKQYHQKVTMLLQQLQSSDKLIAQIKDKLKTAKHLIKIDKKLINTGNLRITDYLLAIQHHLSIKNNLNQAKMKRYQIINKLNYWNH